MWWVESLDAFDQGGREGHMNGFEGFVGELLGPEDAGYRTLARSTTG